MCVPIPTLPPKPRFSSTHVQKTRIPNSSTHLTTQLIYNTSSRMILPRWLSHHDRAQPRVQNDSQHRTNWIQTPCSLSSKTFLNWLHWPSQSDLAQIFKLCQTHPSLYCVSGSFPITGSSIVSRTLYGKYLPKKNYVTQNFPKSIL